VSGVGHGDGGAATGIALLGSTGSIGRSALAVIARHPERFRVVALTAHRNAGALAEQAARHRPRLAVLTDGDPEALLPAATHPDAAIVLNAVVGAAGLEATLAALGAGKRLALANKESLVAGGDLVLDALRRGGGELVPVDSEHSAILQCLRGGSSAEVRRLILTASGGAFRDRPLAGLDAVRPADALRHPTWQMGAKVTIDSATMANKALEVIEAHYLFGIPYERIDVVVHRQSIVHSMVEFVDGSVVAQLGFPSMELPILYAFGHPARVPDAAHAFDPVAAGPLSFEAVDAARYPAFALGLAAGRTGGTAPAVFNAANEEAVAAFLAGMLPFPRIARIIEAVLERSGTAPAGTLEAVRHADAGARRTARQLIEERC
jgi:1-deoxy-D-xylulose-5-phosphate reductoisomerase